MEKKKLPNEVIKWLSLSRQLEDIKWSNVKYDKKNFTEYDKLLFQLNKLEEIKIHPYVIKELKEFRHMAATFTDTLSFIKERDNRINLMRYIIDFINTHVKFNINSIIGNIYNLDCIIGYLAGSIQSFSI